MSGCQAYRQGGRSDILKHRLPCLGYTKAPPVHLLISWCIFQVQLQSAFSAAQGQSLKSPTTEHAMQELYNMHRPYLPVCHCLSRSAAASIIFFKLPHSSGSLKHTLPCRGSSRSTKRSDPSPQCLYHRSAAQLSSTACQDTFSPRWVFPLLFCLFLFFLH